MTIHDLDADVLLAVLSICDVDTVLTVAQVSKFLRSIALAKPVWLSLVADLNARCLMDPLPNEILATCSTSDLISESSPVWYPYRYPPQAIPGITDRGNAAVRLLPGGRYITILHETRFECWNLMSGERVWTRERSRFYGVEMLDGGTSARFLLIPYAVIMLEVVQVDLLTGVSQDLFRMPTPNINYYASGFLSGDFFSVGVRLHDGAAVLLVNWREATHILFYCSRSQTNPGMVCIPGHLILSTTTTDWPYRPLLVTYTLASVADRWRPVGNIDPDIRIDDTSPITPLRVDDLGIDKLWQTGSGPIQMKLALYRSPLRYDMSKLLLHLSGVILRDRGAPAAEAVPPANKHRFTSRFRRKPALPATPQASGMLFTYHLSASAAMPSGLHLTRTSAIPSISDHWFHEFSYTGYALNSSNVSVFDLRRRRGSESELVLNTLPGRVPHLSPTSGAVTRVVDSGVVIEYHL